MMRRLIMLISVLGLAFGPVMASAEYSGAFGLSGLPSLQSFGWMRDYGDCADPHAAKINVQSFAKIGYQTLGINLNFPVPGAPVTNYLMDTMDVKQSDAQMWIGDVGLDLTLAQKLRILLAIGASIPKSASIATNFGGEASTALFGGNTGWNWPSSGLQWAELDARASYTVVESLAIVGGFRADRLTQKLSAPGQAAYTFTAPVLQEKYFGDLEILTRSPYIGLEFSLNNELARFNFLWSPWLTSYDVNMPLRIILQDTGGLANAESLYYLSAAGGTLLELSGDYKIDFGNLISGALWGKGSWLQCKGNATEDFRDSSNSIFYISTPGSNSADSTYSRYLWAGGVAATLKF